MEERRSLSLLSLSRLYRFTIISVRSESSMIGSRDELPVESLSYLFRRILKLNVSTFHQRINLRQDSRTNV